MRGRAAVLTAVLHDRDLRALEFAFVGFNMTEYATWIAILVYAYARGGSAEAGAVAVIQLVPAAVVAPFAAYASDRYRRDRVLVAEYLAQAAALGLTAAALLTGLAAVVVYPLAVVAAASLTFTRPAHNAILPAVARTPEDLTAANVVTSVAEGCGIMAGPLVGGILLGVSGPGLVFAVFGLVMLAGAALARTVHIEGSLMPSEAVTAGGAWRQTLAGFSTLARVLEPRLLVLVLSAGIAVIGALDVLFVATAIDLLRIGQSGVGYLNAAFGVGGVVGAAATVSLVGRRRLTPPLAAGSFAFAVPLGAVAAAPSVATAPLFFAVSGAGRSIADVAGRTLLQRASPKEVLARVFGLFEGLAMIALAIGAISASALVDALGIRTALGVAGAFVPIVWLGVGRALVSIDRRASAPDPLVLALLRRVPIFAPLPAPVIERLVADVVRLEVPAGTVVIREGDTGERFFVIAEGEVDVTSRGRFVSRRGAGDYVGEIALLRDVPRTATVRAATPLVLYALDRDVFLAAVTGHPRSRAMAERRIDRDLALTRSGNSGD
jgi:MFS family permease